MPYTTEGKHDIADLWGCSFSLLNDEQTLIHHIKQAIFRSGATILSIQSHRFHPQGITILAMLSESHMSLHTYPEKGFCGMDCYTCGDSINSDASITYMIDYLSPTSVQRKLLKRGDGEILDEQGVSKCIY
ncbi:adenosylmethionine decarboxylase [Salibacterium salarium]|uniref:S-adenosylmethionine decarboxylase proenzyme n=1 Tax=Salibacterium salarium TaxID=284579 RepID=A0A3R9P8G9_9BACI|nr:adenosylmethionine decarboxylase [Salibacterium salarium]RSL33708.1 adenosylmethionine decarboxylase [Salibacterium salarium]